MKFEYYYVTDNEGNSNCVIRTFAKLFNQEYNFVKEKLIDIANELKLDNYIEIEVFEKYLYDNGYIKLEQFKDKKIKDLDIKEGTCAIFCYDKKDFYHMLCLENNIIYDRTEDSLELYVISLYKKIVNG